MAHYNFDKDIKDGREAENQAIEIISKKYNLAKEDIVICDTKEYDFKVISRNETYEVKNDLMAEKTGNIAIEYNCRGKDSGIATTKANYWIYKFAGLFFLLKTEKIREELFKKNNYSREVTGGDVGSNTKMFLVKVVEFKKWGVQI